MAQDLCQRLIGGMDLRVFNERVREQRSEKFPSAFSATDIAQVLNLTKLERLGRNGKIPKTSINVVDRGQPSSMGSDVREDALLGEMAFHLREGRTLRISNMQRADRSLARFSDAVGDYFSALVQLNAYLTPPRATGFMPHYDTTDIFIVQCSGEKQWSLFSPAHGEPALPLEHQRWRPGARDRLERCALRLSQGDVLYLPRGTVHQAHCLDVGSLHLTISLDVVTLFDALLDQLYQYSERDVEIRKRLPLAGELSGPERSALTKLLRAALQKVSGQIGQQIKDCSKRPHTGREPARGVLASVINSSPSTKARSSGEDSRSPAL